MAEWKNIVGVLVVAAFGGSVHQADNLFVLSRSLVVDSPRAPMPIPSCAMAQAALSYEVNCSTCHGARGEGIESMIPSLAGNDVPKAQHLIEMIIAGTTGGQRGVHMPPFGWKMSNEEIARLANYVLSNWGGAAICLTAEDVANAREALAG
ncbi:c-type cytochrome [Rhizobium leguminosarum]|uniref:c-type cytochrome n=1 Tax=Rhizobium leguminosarum TaxID=384 RepID=UPI00048D73DA|nr:cytochrome c [Rhizobium leguminosarum]